MNNQSPRSTRSNVSDGDEPDDAWHDLVVAVVACEGSPRVTPPASMRAGLELKLGFARRSTGWRGVWLACGVAAVACGLVLVAQVWRMSLGEKDSKLAAKERAGWDTSGGEAGAAGVGAAVAASAAAPTTVRGATQEPEKTSGAVDGAGIAATASTLHVGGVEPLNGGEFAAAKGLGAAPMTAGADVRTKAENLGAEREELQFKSGFYVEGMLAAAMQLPASENPYEAAQQVLEWTEWTEGYERGSELPASVVLAWGDAFAAQNPGDPALSAGMPDAAGAETLTGDDGEHSAAVKADPDVVSKSNQAAQ